MSNEYPSGWADQPPPNADDPLLGDNLDPWRPDAAEVARVLEVLLQYVTGQHTFTWAILSLAKDCYRDKTVPEILLACCEIFRIAVIGCQGEQLTVDRLTADLQHARQEAFREATR
jgi:hypothetical protein